MHMPHFETLCLIRLCTSWSFLLFFGNDKKKTNMVILHQWCLCWKQYMRMIRFGSNGIYGNGKNGKTRWCTLCVSNTTIEELEANWGVNFIAALMQRSSFHVERRWYLFTQRHSSNVRLSIPFRFYLTHSIKSGGFWYQVNWNCFNDKKKNKYFQT